MAPAAYFAKAAKAKERGPTEKKWEVKGGRREEIVNVKVNVNEKAKGGNRKKLCGLCVSAVRNRGSLIWGRGQTPIEDRMTDF